VYIGTLTFSSAFSRRGFKSHTPRLTPFAN
jgi:hypothetical protein